MQENQGVFKAAATPSTARERARELIRNDKLDARDRFKLWDIAYGPREPNFADALTVRQIEGRAS